MKNSIIDLLRPQNVFMTKRRLGAPHEDGGYIMADYVLENCVALFTYGVGNDYRYEEDFSSKYKKPSYLFDHTPSSDGLALNVLEDQKRRYVDELKRINELGLHFFPQGLGFQEKCKDFQENYEELNINGPVLLKIDVEGHEYNYFMNTDMAKLADKVMAIIVEFHWVCTDTNRDLVLKVLNDIEEYFILFHIHGNRWGDIKLLEGRMTPETLELSFINKKYVEKCEPDEQNYPIKGLDVSNRPSHPDYQLTFLRGTEDTPEPITHVLIVPEECMQMSIGDVVDRYNICRLKSEKGRIDCSKEFDELSGELLKYEGLVPYIDQLYELNSKIWDLEADIKIENEKILGLEEIGRRTLRIRDLNNIRNNIKKEINLKYNQGFTDIKINDIIETNDKESSVIISLTTVPERLADMADTGIVLTIKSLCEQQDDDYQIHFNIPEIYNITKQPYIIPEWIFEYQKTHPQLKIFRTEDMGPPTKIIPTLQRIKNPETILVVVDDDLVYYPDMVFEHRKYQNILDDCAICYDGREPIPREKYGDLRDSWVSCVTEIREVEMLQHYKSVSYKKKLFTQDFYDYYVGKTLSDDILVSTFLNDNKIRMFVVPYEKELHLFLTKELWDENLGVTTFPVKRYTSSVADTGCHHPGLLALPIGGRFYIPPDFGKNKQK